MCFSVCVNLKSGSVGEEENFLCTFTCNTFRLAMHRKASGHMKASSLNPQVRWGTCAMPKQLAFLLASQDVWVSLFLRFVFKYYFFSNWFVYLSKTLSKQAPWLVLSLAQVNKYTPSQTKWGNQSVTNRPVLLSAKKMLVNLLLYIKNNEKKRPVLAPV